MKITKKILTNTYFVARSFFRWGFYNCEKRGFDECVIDA